MGLQHSDRASLEKIIDEAINHMPEIIQIFRSDKIKHEYQIKNPDEFTYGYIHGKIMTLFSASYVTTHENPLGDEQFIEIRDVLKRRSRDIKEAIFNCG